MSIMPHADRTKAAQIHITPDRLKELLDTWDAALPRTADESFRLLDGRPVTKEDYFSAVAKHRSQRNDRP